MADRCFSPNQSREPRVSSRASSRWVNTRLVVYVLNSGILGAISFFIFAASYNAFFFLKRTLKLCQFCAHQSLLHRPLGLGMVGITKELIRRNLLKNPVGLINLLSKCKSFFISFKFHNYVLILGNTITAVFFWS